MATVGSSHMLYSSCCFAPTTGFYLHVTKCGLVTTLFFNFVYLVSAFQVSSFRIWLFLLHFLGIPRTHMTIMGSVRNTFQ